MTLVLSTIHPTPIKPTFDVLRMKPCAMCGCSVNVRRHPIVNVEEGVNKVLDLCTYCRDLWETKLKRVHIVVMH